MSTPHDMPMPAHSDEADTRPHWRQYGMEAALLGGFMVSACSFALMLEHPGSPTHDAIGSPFVRRVLMGLAMGGTAIALIYSRWGKRSGAHMNPAVTLSFLRLGRITRADAAWYIVAHFVGASIGVSLMALLLRSHLAAPTVNYVATLPGSHGLIVAWIAEFAIAAVLMFTVLSVNRFPSLAPYTGYFAGALVALYIAFEAPLSGMSLNPARSFGSALAAHAWPALWVYFTAPPLGMLSAVELRIALTRRPHDLCCKLSHCPHVPCIIKCNCVRLAKSAESTAQPPLTVERHPA